MAEQDRGRGRPGRFGTAGKGKKKERPFSAEELERRAIRKEEDRVKAISDWLPKTNVGRIVKAGEVKNMDEFFAKGYKIMEPEIVDALVPDIKDKLVHFTKTARVTRQGRSFSFRASVLVGDGNSYVGLGVGTDREKISAIEKATRQAKMGLQKSNRGCGSWECRCREPHSIPFEVEGNSSSVCVRLLPAPRGTGLVVGDRIKEVLKFAGVKDVWCKTKGSTATTLDFVSATVDALGRTNSMRLSDDVKSKLEAKR